MADDWCCKGTDPSCDGPQECANRAALLIEAQQAEIERLQDKVEQLRSLGDEVVLSLYNVSVAGEPSAYARWAKACDAWRAARRRPRHRVRPTPRPGERPMTRTHLEILAHLQIEADFVVDRVVVTRGQRLVLRDLLQQAHDVIDRLNDENEALRIDLAAAYCRMDDIEGLNDE